MVTKVALQFISEGGQVERFHTRATLKPDTVAAHGFGVLMMAALLAGNDETGRTKASATLLLACATHDLAEQASSDVSAPSKRLLGIGDRLHLLETETLEAYGLGHEWGLTFDEEMTLRLADQFDCLLYCCRELALGNSNVMLVWRRTCSYVEELAADLPSGLAFKASDMYEAIKAVYHEVTGPGGPAFDVFDR